MLLQCITVKSVSVSVSEDTSSLLVVIHQYPLWTLVSHHSLPEEGRRRESDLPTRGGEEERVRPPYQRRGGVESSLPTGGGESQTSLPEEGRSRVITPYQRRGGVESQTSPQKRSRESDLTPSGGERRSRESDLTPSGGERRSRESDLPTRGEERRRESFVLLAHLMNVARQKTGYRQKPSGTVVSFKPCSPPTVHAPHCPLRPSHHGGEQSLQPLCSPALERTTPCHPQRRLRIPVQIKLRTHLFQSAYCVVSRLSL